MEMEDFEAIIQRLEKMNDGILARQDVMQARLTAKIEDGQQKMKIVTKRIENETDSELKVAGSEDEKLNNVGKEVKKEDTSQKEEQPKNTDIGPIQIVKENSKGPDEKELRPLNSVLASGKEEPLMKLHRRVSECRFGFRKRLKLRFCWIGLPEDFADWCCGCAGRATGKEPRTGTRGAVRSFNVGAPVKRVVSDVAGPGLRTKKGSRCVLVSVNASSRWAQVSAVPSWEASTADEVLVDGIFTLFWTTLKLHEEMRKIPTRGRNEIRIESDRIKMGYEIRLSRRCFLEKEKRRLYHPPRRKRGH